MIAIIIVSILLLCYFFVATERLTNVNKAAVAVFAGTVGWVLYICYGTDFVMERHASEYLAFLNGASQSSDAVKYFICRDVFLPYVGQAAEIVLFLLTTMTIVEILHNNACFDFLTVWLRTRNSRLLLWKLVAFSFLLSANLDNISSTVMMLTVMNSILPRTKDRIVFGSVVVLAVNFGGILTVIGDPVSLLMWSRGGVTASAYSLSLMVPCLIAVALPTYLVGRGLGETVELDNPTMPFRGDDTNLNVWQRLVMLLVGIGGLWFIPTFHAITKLSPFLGAMCVLSVLWIVNEVFNHNLMGSDRRLSRSIPQQLQYNIIQYILYIIGIMLAVCVVKEVGMFVLLTYNVHTYINNVWILGVVSCVVSLFLDAFATSMTMISMYDVAGIASELTDETICFAQDGLYWRMIAYCSAVGSSIFGVASVSGIVFMQKERAGMMWYFRHVGIKVLPAGIIGLLVLWLTA